MSSPADLLSPSFPAAVTATTDAADVRGWFMRPEGGGLSVSTATQYARGILNFRRWGLDHGLEGPLLPDVAAKVLRSPMSASLPAYVTYGVSAWTRKVLADDKASSQADDDLEWSAEVCRALLDLKEAEPRITWSKLLRLTGSDLPVAVPGNLTRPTRYGLRISPHRVSTDRKTQSAVGALLTALGTSAPTAGERLLPPAPDMTWRAILHRVRERAATCPD